MKAPYEGQPPSDKSDEQKNFSMPKFQFGDSSQSIPSVVLSEAVEKVLQAPLLHAKEPVRDPNLRNDVFLHMFISMMVCTGIIIIITVPSILNMQYPNMMLTEEMLYLLTVCCSIVSGVLVLISAVFVALCADCNPRSKQLAHFRMALTIVAMTIFLLVATITLAVTSRLDIEFDQTVRTSRLTRSSSVMGEPIVYENNSIIKVYPEVVHKLYLNPFSTYSFRVKAVLTEAISLYNSSCKIKHYWDSAQKQLLCCGVEDSSNWLTYLPHYPKSCYVNANDSKGFSSLFYTGGCLIRLAYLQAWYCSMMAGSGAVTLLIMVGVFFLLFYMYKLERKKPKIGSSRVSIKSQMNKRSKCSFSPISMDNKLEVPHIKEV